MTECPATAPRWTAAIFDLDGTLVDTIELDVSTASIPTITSSYEGRSLVGSVGEAPDAHRALEAHKRASGDAVETVQTSYQGMFELLRDLSAAGVKVGVATSKGRQVALRSVAAAGLSQVLELTTTADETTLQKPHPEPILHAQRELNATDEACVYIGDATWDVRAGAAAGVDQLAVTWGACSAQELSAEAPSAGVASSVAELRQLLLG